jgi:hypothetical protein
MSRTLAVDTITFDPRSKEFVLYLIEDGPWPGDPLALDEELSRIQGRVFDAFDVVVDGGLSEKLPESRGESVRIQIDSPSGEPAELAELISRLNDFITSNSEYARAVTESQHVSAVRIVSGHQLGRFGK